MISIMILKKSRKQLRMISIMKLMLVTIEFELEFRYRRLPCVVHTLQLAVNSLDKCDSFVAETTTARGVVRAIWASSVATQLLTRKCCKTAIADCPT